MTTTTTYAVDFDALSLGPAPTAPSATFPVNDVEGSTVVVANPFGSGNVGGSLSGDGIWAVNLNPNISSVTFYGGYPRNVISVQFEVYIDPLDPARPANDAFTIIDIAGYQSTSVSYYGFLTGAGSTQAYLQVGQGTGVLDVLLSGAWVTVTATLRTTGFTVAFTDASGTPLPYGSGPATFDFSVPVDTTTNAPGRGFTLGTVGTSTVRNFIRNVSFVVEAESAPPPPPPPTGFIPAPPLRLHPRSDGLGLSSAVRVWPPPRSQQRGGRPAPGSYL